MHYAFRNLLFRGPFPQICRQCRLSLVCGFTLLSASSCLIFPPLFLFCVLFLSSSFSLSLSPFYFDQGHESESVHHWVVSNSLWPPWTIAHQAPLSMEFPRQEYWSGLPFLSPGDLLDPEIKPGSPALQADSLPSEPPGKPDPGHTNQVFLAFQGRRLIMILCGSKSIFQGYQVSHECW